VAELGPLRLSGLLGWLVWVVVHILFLIGFRNRLLVMVEWAWAYVTFNRGVRLITGDTTLASRQRRRVEESTEPRARAS
jgi:NADH dehydrogenase